MPDRTGPSPDLRGPNKRPPEKKDPLKGAAEELPYLDEQQLTDDEKELLAEAYGRLDAWQNDCRIYHDRAIKCRKVYRLKDEDQDPPGTPEHKKMLQLQTLKSTLNNCIADQVDNTPEAMLVAQRQDLADVAVEMSNVVKFVMQQNDILEFHRKRAEDFHITGTAVTQVMWDEDMDYGLGNIAVRRYPIENMVWDPMATEVQDARAMMKLSWHPLSWYTEHYPDQAVYIHDDTTDRHDVALETELSSLSANQQEGKALLVEYWYRRYDRKKRRHTINVAYLAGGALLEVYEDVYAHGLYPFIFDVYSTIEGSMVGEGQVDELAAMMRYINRYAYYIDQNLAASSKLRMLVRKGSGINTEDLADFSRNLIEGDIIDEDAVRWLENKPLNGLAAQQLFQYQNDMKQDSGQSQFSRGEVTGGVDAASAIQLLQNAGSKITRLRTRILSDGFKKIVEQVLWLAAEFYTDERVVYITGDDTRPTPVRLSSRVLMGDNRKKGPLEPPPYTVRIEIQRANPAAIQAMNDLYIQAYTMSAQAGQVFPLTALFQLLNVEGKERVLPVLEQVDAQTQQMQQLAQQNQVLQQQVDNLTTTLDSYAQQLTTDTEDLATSAFGEDNINMM